MEGRNYQIISTIATGSTAVLYKAIQTSLDRPVVIKKLHAHLTSDPNFTRRFELEAKAAASLDHENIVRIIDSGSSYDNYYIIMEYIDGISLKEVLEKTGALNEDAALLIAHEICMGLDHAHQRGIVHRDIKPANIMITREGQVKITDFGLAKLRLSQVQQTTADTLLGTPLYMSPEQAIGETVDGRSDIFSLGSICYEMLTAVHPFSGNNYAAVIQNIVNGSVPAPSKRNVEINSEAETIIMKALQREPGKRFRTALEMARAIESHIGQDTVLGGRHRLSRLVSSRSCIDPGRTESSMIKRPRRHMIFPLAATLLLITAAVAILGANPDNLEYMRRRISALLAPEPRPAGQDQFMAGHEDMLGDPLSLALSETDSSLACAAEADSANAAPGETSIAMNGPAAADTAERDQSPEAAVTEDTEPQEGKPAVETAAAAAEDKPPPDMPGYIEIYVDPAAEILLDGRVSTFGGHFGPLEIKPGRHDIVCRQDGHRDYRETVVVQKGELSRRRVILQQLTGNLEFDTITGARVYIDGIFKGTVPFSRPLAMSIGNHRVELKKMGYRDWSNTVIIPADETVTLRINLVPR